MIEKMSIVIVVGGVFVTILVCAIMPGVKGRSYASNDFVWRKWQNETGWTSDGFVFMAGCLNGAYVGLFHPFINNRHDELALIL